MAYLTRSATCSHFSTPRHTPLRSGVPSDSPHARVLDDAPLLDLGAEDWVAYYLESMTEPQRMLTLVCARGGDHVSQALVRCRALK